MAIWSCHIDCFKSQYYKALAGHRLFVADTVERIRKRVQVLLHSCNTMSLEDVETGTLGKFGKIQRWVEWVEWITKPPAWVELPAKKNGWRRKS